MPLQRRKLSPKLKNIQYKIGNEAGPLFPYLLSDGRIIIRDQSGIGFKGNTTRKFLGVMYSTGKTDIPFCVNAIDGSKFNATYNVILEQPDKKILIGGAFTNYAGVSGRNSLLRLNPDGTLDTSFCANASDGGKFSSSVASLELQPDGKIIVGGPYINYGGVTGRDKLIRINSDGTLDTAFCANASDGAKFYDSLGTGINSIRHQADGKILLSGNSILNYGGITGRNSALRLNSDGTVDNDFCVNAVDGKFSTIGIWIQIQSDTKILMAGNFSNYAGVTGRDGLIRLNSDGTLDTAFCVNASDGSKFAYDPYYITDLLIQSDGKILVAGGFQNYGGFSGRDALVRLNTDGTLDTAFCNEVVDGPQFVSYIEPSTGLRVPPIWTIVQQPDNKLLLEGNFLQYRGVVGRDSILRLNQNNSVDENFCVVGADWQLGRPLNVMYSKEQSDGKVYVYGDFLTYNNDQDTSDIVRLNSNGSLDTVFWSNAVNNNKFGVIGSVKDVEIQTDGKVLVGGQIVDYAGTAGRRHLLRLESNGVLDTAFCANASDSFRFSSDVDSIRIQTDGKILVGGRFTNYLLANRNYFIRLNSDGTVDTAFCLNASNAAKFNNFVYVIATQPDGKILAGGVFSNYGATIGRNYLVRFNSDGTLDTAFCVNASDGGKFSPWITSIAVQTDGKILVGGLFTAYAGVTGRNRLIRLNSDGTLDTAFCANAVDSNKVNGTVNAIEIQPDGKILLGGLFINYGGVIGRNRLIRLNSDGTADEEFCVNAVDGTKLSNSVTGIGLLQNNQILITGLFSYVRFSGDLTSYGYAVTLRQDGGILK